MRNDRGNARPDVIATDDGGMPNLDAGNIRDRIQRPGRQNADLQPQVRGARARNRRFERQPRFEK